MRMETFCNFGPERRLLVDDIRCGTVPVGTKRRIVIGEIHFRH